MPFGNICTYTLMQIFTSCTVYNGNLHVPAKFRFDRLNSCGYIANFRFPMWRPSAMLNLWNMQISTFRMIYSQNLPICTKFCHDRLNGCGDIANFRFSIWRPPAMFILWNMQTSTFRTVCSQNPFWSFGWWVPIHAPILGTFRGYDTLKVVTHHRDP